MLQFLDVEWSNKWCLIMQMPSTPLQ